MLIRSQDKSRLVSLNNTRELRFWECAQGFNITDCIRTVDEQPTAFDLDKVVEQFRMKRVKARRKWRYVHKRR